MLISHKDCSFPSTFLFLHYLDTHFLYDLFEALKDDSCIENCVLTINPYRAGIDFSRQNLKSVDVRFWRLKSIPAL